MTNEEVERIYTAMAECIHRIGKEKTPLLLATLALDVLHREARVEDALEYLRRAEDSLNV